MAARLAAVVTVAGCLLGCGDDQATDRSALDCVSWNGQLAEDPDPALGFATPDLALARQARADERLPAAAAAYVRQEDGADLIRFTIDDPGFAAEISVEKVGLLWYPLSYTVCD